MFFSSVVDTLFVIGIVKARRLNKMEKLLRNKYFHLYVKIIGFTIIICSVELLFINVTYGDVLHVNGLNKN